MATILLFTSCENMKYGNVIERWYEPSRKYVVVLPMVISTGKSSSTILIPYIMYDNEDWCVKVKGIGSKGDTITRTYYVDKIAFDTLSVGKFICIDGACDEDNNNTKVKK